MFECDCPCHSNSEMKHCDNLSCMPCCTECKHCNRKIMLGKMIPHLLEDHGIDEHHKAQKLTDNTKFVDAVNDLKDLVLEETKNNKKPS